MAKKAATFLATQPGMAVDMPHIERSFINKNV
jgi:hypothetical protein